MIRPMASRTMHQGRRKTTSWKDEGIAQGSSCQRPRDPKDSPQRAEDPRNKLKTILWTQFTLKRHYIYIYIYIYTYMIHIDFIWYHIYPTSYVIHFNTTIVLFLFLFHVLLLFCYKFVFLNS